MLPLRTGANDAYEMPLVGFFKDKIRCMSPVVQMHEVVRSKRAQHCMHTHFLISSDMAIILCLNVSVSLMRDNFSNHCHSQ